MPLDRLREQLGDGACCRTPANTGPGSGGRSSASTTRPLPQPRAPAVPAAPADHRRPDRGRELTTELGEALPPFDDDVLDSVAHNLDDLETVREDLGRLERTHGALTELMTGYRGYLQGELRRRVGAVDDALAELRAGGGGPGSAERDVAGRRRRRGRVAEAAVAEWDRAARAARAELTALRDSAGYRAVRDLGQRRQAVQALQSAARAAAGQAAGARATSARRPRPPGCARRPNGIATASPPGCSERPPRTPRQSPREAGLDVGHLGVPPALRYDGRRRTDPAIRVVDAAAAGRICATYAGPPGQQAEAAVGPAGARLPTCRP